MLNKRLDSGGIIYGEQMLRVCRGCSGRARRVPAHIRVVPCSPARPSRPGRHLVGGPRENEWRVLFRVIVVVRNEDFVVYENTK